MLLMTNNYKFVSKKKNTSIDCEMMTSSLCQTCSVEMYIQLYCPRLRAYHCGTWYLVTIFVDDLPHYIKKRKKTSYRRHQYTNITENTHSALSYRCHGWLLQNIGTLGSFILIMTDTYEFVSKEYVYRLYNDGVIIVPDMLHRDIQLYCPRRRAYYCGIWHLVTIYIDNLPHYIKNRK